MGIRKKYVQQRNQTFKLKRPSSTKDTTIPNMLGYSASSNSKDYGKVKSKGGVSKVEGVSNNYGNVKKGKTKRKRGN